MLKIKDYFIFVVLFALIVYPLATFGQNSLNQEKNETAVKQNIQKNLNNDKKQQKPGLTITPQEINLGTITMDKSGEEIFTLINNGSEDIGWSTEGPEDWKKIENQKISGVLKNKTDSLRVGIRLLPKESEDKQKNTPNYMEMKLEAGGGSLICRKEFTVGTHKEEIKINSADGEKRIFVTFVLGYTQKNPLINLNPLRLDMGSILPEKIVSKKIMVTNSGREILKWSASVKKHEGKDTPEDFQKNRYMSFVNEDVRGSGVYAAPENLKEIIELIGKWKESNGYPSGAEGDNLIKINFRGTGIILYLLTYQENGMNMAISLDKNPIDNIELRESLDENKGELLIAENLADGPHVLTIVSKNSRLVFEGFKIIGAKTAYFPQGSIKIMPNSGATTRQTNYLNVTLNTRQMASGYYVDDIVFDTNGGEGIVEVFAEIVSDNVVKVIDIYRYYNGTDYLFTANPQSETKRLSQNNYAKQGIAFRLFKPETPGTTCFYRWYNPQKKDHFYHYNLAGGGKNLQGYIFEGSIGNIATSRLTNTKELYRWYNSKAEHYFYSTDPKGEKINKKKYRFDGIAGYVK